MSESVQSTGGGSSTGYRVGARPGNPSSARRSAQDPPTPGASQPAGSGAADASRADPTQTAPSTPRTASGIPPPEGDPRFEAYLNQLARAGPRNALESLILMRYGKAYTPSNRAEDASLSILS
ncbi:MAG TPA: hypothetical protein PKB10_12985 [Tepidisphaeraceae bacterium]|nr:hypothetical protein [Tepidisphaeraceae bacterium]